MKTRKEVQGMNGKMVKRTVLKGATIESDVNFKKDLLEDMKSKGLSEKDLIEDERTFQVAGFTNFWFKSKMHETETKEFHISSSGNFTFGDCHGTLEIGENFELTENGFINKSAKYELLYELV